ncbi:MAG: T9SS type A sorting domain-containing protein [Bacteroidetes bacterium]|nr:T9SS type A sorting domain-containing protein [Bacteroidota bacterium]
MKNKHLLFILLLFIFTRTTAQCPPDGIIFRNQADINSFQTNYPNCSEIIGVGVEGDDIVNLNGLNNLVSIEQNLVITQNSLLTDLSGLNNLTYIGGNLAITNNSSLTNLSGLDNLGYLGGSLLVLENYSLQTLTQFKTLDSIGGELWFSYNTSLASLSGLDSLSNIGEKFILEGSGHLANLSGLEGLQTIGLFVSIMDNDSLVNLSGLENLTSINGNLGISHNDMLTSLHGIENINPESIGDIWIQNNPSLTTCDIQNICDYLSNPNGVHVENNASGCNSQEEIEEACLVSVPNSTNNPQLTFYPNPAKDEIFISTETGYAMSEILLYNQLGQKVLRKSGITREIDLTNFKPGLYILEFVTNELKIRRKLIIE